jgi:hypothetical protein
MRHEQAIMNAPAYVRRHEQRLRQARHARGPVQARAAEERGAAMSLDAAAEYALMLAAPGPRQPPVPPGQGGSAPANGS